MLKRNPVIGSFYVHKDNIYKVHKLSRGTDEIYLRGFFDGKIYTESFSVFGVAYEKVFKVTEVASMLNRAPRSIYRYETRGQIEKPNRYPDRKGCMVRFYRMKDVVEIHELISLLHIGRPRKDRRIVNNTLPDRASLLEILKERYAD